MEVSIEDLREIVKLAVESDLQVLYLEVGGVTMGLSKTDAAGPLLFGGAAAAPRPATAGPAETAPAPAEAAARPEPEAPAAPAAAPAEARPSPVTARKEGLTDVAATSLGVVYRRPAPDQPAFVDVGSEVHAGDTVCLIEVMKTYNRVEAPCSGRVAEICVADGTMVEHGRTLMRIEPLV